MKKCGPYIDHIVFQTMSRFTFLQKHRSETSCEVERLQEKDRKRDLEDLLTHTHTHTHTHPTLHTKKINLG